MKKESYKLKNSISNLNCIAHLNKRNDESINHLMTLHKEQLTRNNLLEKQNWNVNSHRKRMSKKITSEKEIIQKNTNEYKTEGRNKGDFKQIYHSFIKRTQKDTKKGIKRQLNLNSREKIITKSEEFKKRLNKLINRDKNKEKASSNNIHCIKIKK